MDECKLCGRTYNGVDPDPCLGYLPCVDYACCGHGVGGGYIAFSNGRTIYFNTVNEVTQRVNETFEGAITIVRKRHG